MMQRAKQLMILWVPLLVAWSAFAGSAPSAGAHTTLLFDAPDPQGTLLTDGAFVVWSIVNQTGGGDYLYRRREIYAASLKDRQPFLVVGDLGELVRPAALADGVVAWQAIDARGIESERNHGIRAKDLKSGRDIAVAAARVPLPVTFTPGPVVGDGWVVWIEITGRDTPSRLMGRDVRSMASPIVLAAEYRGGPLHMSGKRAVWVESGPVSQNWRVWAVTIGAGSPTVVAEGTSVSPPQVVVGGDLVVLVPSPPDTGIVVINVRTGVRLTLTNHGVANLTTDGRYVVWRGGEVSPLGYDLVTSSLFRLPFPVSHLANGVGVWYQPGQQGSDRGFHAALVADLLPAARQPALASVGPDLVYFAETGHGLSFGFKGFWERSGGLPVFGFPLTEEFEQRNADTGQMHTVQYLERQRFEYHPDLAGTPYEVSLGRLGVEDAAQRADLRGVWAFNPITATADHPAGCRYLAEAGHRLCGEFRPHWEGHGLDLGDDGVSFRESLALFGYPISEEFIDPRTGLIAQYFERAVFEYHPDLPVGQRVLLRRLGAERLAAMGW